MARTTTTIIRTTQGTGGGSRRRSTTRRRSSASRSRKSRIKTRTVTPAQYRQITTKENRTEGKTNYLPLLGLAGLLGLGAILFWPKNANAAPNPPGPNPPGPFPPGPLPPGPVPGPVGPINPNEGGNPNPSPGGFVHPPPGTRATVNATVGIPAGATPGLNMRSTPSPSGGLLVALPNGTAITVVQSNVVESGRTAANKERWWQVTANGRTGYVRAVGPGANANAPYVWNVSFLGQQTATGHLITQGFAPTRGFSPMPANLETNYTQIAVGYDMQGRQLDQFGQLMPGTPPLSDYQRLVMRQRGVR